MSEIFFWGLDSIFMQIPPFFHYANMASGHMSEHTLLGCGKKEKMSDIYSLFVVVKFCISLT